ncbi:leukocyte immunoglobulin-like receptor subfamily A member 3 [Clarias gariepinus]
MRYEVECHAESERNAGTAVSCARRIHYRTLKKYKLGPVVTSLLPECQFPEAIRVTCRELWSTKTVVFIEPDTHVYGGEKVMLRCDIQGGGDTEWTYSWYRNNDRLGPRIPYGEYTDSTSQWYRILPVIDSDSGDYTCRGWSKNSQSSEISDAVKLTVSVIPQVVLSVSPQGWLTEGDSVTLSCEVSDSSTSWKFRWYRVYTSREIQDHHGNYVYGDSYTISPVARKHTGVYRCIAERKTSSLTLSSILQTLWTTGSIPLIPVTHAQGSTKPVVSIKPDTHVYRGERVIFRCDIQRGGDSEWTYSWYKNNDGLDPHIGDYIWSVSDSDSGDYTCRGWSKDSRSSVISDPVTLTVSGENPPVSLIINPNRTQHFTGDSLSLSCEDQRHSTGWTVRRYTHSERVLDCSWWGSVTGSTCKISSLSTSYTGVYWCESKSGESSNPVNITVHDGDVILESPVHPLSKGHPLTLRCLDRNTNSLILRSDFYKDGSVLQTQTTGEMIIHNVSKSDEGLYHCRHSEREESEKSWVSVRGVEAPFSVLMLICSVVTASPYLLVTIILLIKRYRARVHTDGGRIENAVIEE